ncbi:hypothetical protein OXX59_008322 [Metschnikowia pulcherrima]
MRLALILSSTIIQFLPIVFAYSDIKVIDSGRRIQNDPSSCIENTEKTSFTIDAENRESVKPQYPKLEFSKRSEENLAFARMVDNLLQRIAELGFRSLIDHNYFDRLKEVGTGIEKERIFDCRHKSLISNSKMLANIAYRLKDPTNDYYLDDSHSQVHGFIYEDPSGFALLGLIGESNEWLPEYQYSIQPGYSLLTHTREYFANKYIDRLSPRKYLEKAWKGVKKEKDVLGGATALYITVNPEKQIKLANIGRDWAGLYRNGELFASTAETLHKDGSQYHLCKWQGNFRPIHHKDSTRDCQKSEWQAQAQDVLLVVSYSVRKTLSPAQIFEHSQTFQKYEFSDDQFVGASVGIVRGARSSPGELSDTEKIAIAVKFI